LSDSQFEKLAGHDYILWAKLQMTPNFTLW